MNDFGPLLVVGWCSSCGGDIALPQAWSGYGLPTWHREAVWNQHDDGTASYVMQQGPRQPPCYARPHHFIRKGAVA